MKNTVKNFLADESGLAVVDMTMLMAALVGLALAISAQVSSGMSDLSAELKDRIIAQDAEAAW